MRAPSPSSSTQAAFTPVPPELHRRIVNAAPTAVSLEWAELEVAALREIEIRQPAATPTPPASLRLAAWNLQQGHFSEAAAEILRRRAIDLALLSEVDIGMRRSGQRHTVLDLATRLGREFGYGAGVEFYELTASDNILNPAAAMPDAPGNRLGFHTNGWVSRLPAKRPALLRLGREADWFINPRRNQRRLGGRVAVAATFSLAGTDFVAATTHLESDTDPAGRRRQMEDLLERLDAYAGGLPVVIGGDFNAGARQPRFDYTAEGLFDAAASHGYGWLDANTNQPTSRPSLVENAVQQDQARYDWFFVRGLTAANPGVVPAVGDTGQPISDHDLLTLTISATVG